MHAMTNLRTAIQRKKARIAEIARVLNRDPRTEWKGQPLSDGAPWRALLEEERQHLLAAVLELEQELARMQQTPQLSKQATPRPLPILVRKRS